VPDLHQCGRVGGDEGTSGKNGVPNNLRPHLQHLLKILSFGLQERRKRKKNQKIFFEEREKYKEQEEGKALYGGNMTEADTNELGKEDDVAGEKVAEVSEGRKEVGNHIIKGLAGENRRGQVNDSRGASCLTLEEGSWADTAPGEKEREKTRGKVKTNILGKLEGSGGRTVCKWGRWKCDSSQ